MKFNEIKIGDRVEDAWYWFWGVGVVKAILKTKVKVLFPSVGSFVSSWNGFRTEIVPYDKSHCQFLRRHHETNSE